MVPTSFVSATFRLRDGELLITIPLGLARAPARLSLDGYRGRAHRLGHMRARWVSFAVGLWLILSPLVLGYPNVSAVLHEVALGLLVCVATLAALEWPLARFAVTAPALWLVTAADRIDWGSRLVASNELACGLAALVLALVPSGKVAAARSPAKMAA
jgi:hypothetical protein